MNHVDGGLPWGDYVVVDLVRHIDSTFRSLPDPEHRAIWQLMLAQKAMGRPFVAPPDLPADRAKALQEAFEATVKGPLFVAEMIKTKKELTPVSGPDIAKMINEVASAPKEILAKVESAGSKMPSACRPSPIMSAANTRCSRPPRSTAGWTSAPARWRR